MISPAQLSLSLFYERCVSSSLYLMVFIFAFRDVIFPATLSLFTNAVSNTGNAALSVLLTTGLDI